MNDVSHDELEWEVKRQKDMALILAKQLNEKIDECENWKEHLRACKDEMLLLNREIASLNDLILSMTKHIK